MRIERRSPSQRERLTFHPQLRVTVAFPRKKDGSHAGDKALRPHPGIPLKKELILQLIKKHKGNLTKAADAMGTTRKALRVRCDNDIELGDALIAARDRWIDDIEESVLSRALESGDTGLQCFVLKTQGRHRGWDQDQDRNAAKDIATAAFDFIIKKKQADEANKPQATAKSDQGAPHQA